jgi:pimeloyl-ACP methyl ester carboxylesterase
MIRLAAVVTALLLFSPSTRAATFEVSMPPDGAEKYKSADFRLWLPDGVKTVKAVIVRQHGCGRNGIDHADDLQWQALAAKHDAALLGTYYQTFKDCKEWFDPALGSERAFLEALKHFAEKTGHPELAAAPWAIWGHSGGAMWACHMLNRHPERVVSVWARSQALTEYNAKALGVPVVFNYGEGEKTGRFEAVHKNSLAAFNTYAPKGALWAVAIDPKSDHNCRNSRHLSIPFFDKTLAARLPGEGTQLRTLSQLAWVGDPESLAIYSNSARRGEFTAQCWLIDAGFAKQWQEYCKTGEVKDMTPPPAPRGLTAVADKAGVTLRWQAAADQESGLKEFAVYKNGRKLASVAGETTKGNPSGSVQIWNYGDEPEPRTPALSYCDPAGQGGDRYEVAAVNHTGLESEKSPAATAR